MVTTLADALADDVARLVAGEHAEPHRLLGAHPTPRGVDVRVWAPGAVGVVVHPADGPPVATTRLHEAGVFGCALADRELPIAYEVETDWGGATTRSPDPYAFTPTLGDMDLHLIAEGRHWDLGRALGGRAICHQGVDGVAMRVWAPSARAVSVVGDFNAWDPRRHPMRTMGASGVWELFLPGLGAGERYKFMIRGPAGDREHADPLALAAEVPPRTASVVHAPRHVWRDEEWMAARASGEPHRAPVSIYEVHAPSWRRVPEDGDRPLDYHELGQQIGDYAVDLGFTHVELMPIMAHPFAGSWGYQVTSQFAPMPALGSPDDLRAMVDALHARGLGVILDWVPAHFPSDEWALARFDGTALYEHDDPRRGLHPDWGTLVFNFGRTEVRNFLVASALHWIEHFHADGLRVDAVASMLYRDYSRESGEWVPNEHGGREDLEAVSFLREVNEVVHARNPGLIVAAEESTAWPAVSRPTDQGGLGFDLKWNMGWMHDTLAYFARDPVHRSWHHDELTFSLVYAFSEQYVLPLSHDEVVHGKGSLVHKMPGDEWQQTANLRALYGYMWAHPGKNLLFMGGEFAQTAEWSHERSLDWHLLQYERHRGVQRLVRDLNGAYRARPALWQRDAVPEGFAWLLGGAAGDNVIAFARFGDDGVPPLVSISNLAPVPRYDYRVPLPAGGVWREVLNTDAAGYWGGDVGNAGHVRADGGPMHGHPASASITLPPLATVWLEPDDG